MSDLETRIKYLTSLCWWMTISFTLGSVWSADLSGKAWAGCDHFRLSGQGWGGPGLVTHYSLCVIREDCHTGISLVE